jgi:hypothetical protein
MIDAQFAPVAASPASVEPDHAHRWRCSACGNLTRFDVVVTRRTAEFWHLDLAGSPTVEESSVLESDVQSVTCRWCGRADAVTTIDRADAPGGDRPEESA